MLADVRRMKISILTVLLMLGTASAQNSNTPLFSEGNIDDTKRDLVILHDIPIAIISADGGCDKIECFIVINDEHEHELARISRRTGKVTLSHPERANEAARRFWSAITRTFNQLHCSQEKK